MAAPPFAALTFNFALAAPPFAALTFNFALATFALVAFDLDAFADGSGVGGASSATFGDHRGSPR